MKIDLNQLTAAGVSTETATRIAKIVNESSDDASQVWQTLRSEVLTPGIPFAIHQLLFAVVYGEWSDADGAPPAWIPTDDTVERSNIVAFAERVGVEFGDLHRWSVDNRAEFWRHAIDAVGVVFDTPPTKILGDRSHVLSPQWLTGATLNIASSCFGADPGHTAIVYQDENGPIRTLSYAELDTLSNRVANSIFKQGLSKGDAIAIAMPMTVEAVAAYLGIVKAGCVVVSIADSFAADEIATRLRISNAKAVITQDVVLRAGKTLPMYEKVTAADAELTIVLPATEDTPPLRTGDITWLQFLVDDESFAAVACAPSDTSNILFSSGTTGDPKAIPWTHTTPIKCAVDGYLHHDVQPGDVVAWPTNLGWMMGPWLIYATLVNRGTIALYYGVPTSRGFCEFVHDAGVKMLGLVPSLVKAWRASDAAKDIDWSGLKLFSSTGESSNAADYLYLMHLAHYRPIIEYCGGTEIGGGYVSGSIVQPASPATFSTPAFGLNFVILDENNRESDDGELYLLPPSIGLSERLLNKDHDEVYYANTPTGPSGETLRRHGDHIRAIGGGYYRAEGRADDTMNLGGIKVSSAEIERAVSTLPGIVETAAIAVNPADGGPSRLVIFTVPDRSSSPDLDEIMTSMQRTVSSTLNPLFKIYDVVMIDALPRTASNKIMRRVLRDQYATTPR